MSPQCCSSAHSRSTTVSPQLLNSSFSFPLILHAHTDSYPVRSELIFHVSCLHAPTLVSCLFMPLLLGLHQHPLYFFLLRLLTDHFFSCLDTYWTCLPVSSFARPLLLLLLPFLTPHLFTSPSSFNFTLNLLRDSRGPAVCLSLTTSPATTTTATRRQCVMRS